MKTWGQFYHHMMIAESGVSQRVEQMADQAYDLVMPALQAVPRLFPQWVQANPNWNDQFTDAFVGAVQQVGERARDAKDMATQVLRILDRNPAFQASGMGIFGMAMKQGATPGRPAGARPAASAPSPGLTTSGVADMGGDEATRDSLEAVIRKWSSQRPGMPRVGLVSDLDPAIQASVLKVFPQHPSEIKAMEAGRGVQLYRNKAGKVAFVLNR
jgi:hypothetical protein